MIIDPRYFVSTITSFSDSISENGIVYGNEGWYMQEIAKALSRSSDNLILFGRCDSCPTAAFYKGNEVTVAYDYDGNEAYYLIKNHTVSVLQEKPCGGFTLIEQEMMNPPKGLRFIQY